jgi:hypothetical protein
MFKRRRTDFKVLIIMLLMLAYCKDAFVSRPKFSKKCFIYPECRHYLNRYSLDEIKYDLISEKMIEETEINDNYLLHYYGDFVYDPIWFYTSSMVREYDRLIHIENAYVSSYKTVSLANGRIIVWNQTEELVFPRFETSKQPYENVVYLYSVWGEVFGHFLHDSLTSLIQIPSSILNKSIVLLQYPLNNAYAYTDLLGYPREMFKFSIPFVFTKNLYMFISAEDRSGQQVVGFRKLRAMLRDKFEVDKINATRYVMSNRNRTRKINNWDDFTLTVRNTFPAYNWEEETIPYNNVEKCAKLLASLIFWFSPCGSNINNVIFMKEGAGVCVAMTNYTDMPNYAAAYISKVWMIGFNNPKMLHFNSTGGVIDVQTGIHCIRSLLYVLKNSSWPNDPKTFHPINSTLIKKRMLPNKKLRYKAIAFKDHIE